MKIYYNNPETVINNPDYILYKDNSIEVEFELEEKFEDELTKEIEESVSFELLYEERKTPKSIDFNKEDRTMNNEKDKITITKYS